MDDGKWRTIATEWSNAIPAVAGTDYTVALQQQDIP